MKQLFSFNDRNENLIKEACSLLLGEKPKVNKTTLKESYLLMKISDEITGIKDEIPYQKFYKRQHDIINQFLEENKTNTSFDVYTGINSYIYKAGCHNTQNVFALKNICIDIDMHNCENAWQIAEELSDYILFNKEFDDYNIPKPNMIVFSGRGLHIYYCFTPASKDLYFIYQDVVRELCKRYQSIINDNPISFGDCDIDMASSIKLDAIFRVPGTYNTKSKCYSIPIILDSTRRNLNELKRILNISYQNSKNKSKSKTKSKILNKKFKTRYQNSYSVICDARIKTIEHEVLYNPHIYSRNMLLFVYHNEALQKYSLQEARDMIIQLNSQFQNPVKNHEINATIRKNEQKLASTGKPYRFNNQTFLEKTSFDASAIAYYKNLSQSDKTDSNRARNERTREKHIKENNQIYKLYKMGYSDKQIANLTTRNVKTIQKRLKRTKAIECKKENNRLHLLEIKKRLAFARKKIKSALTTVSLLETYMSVDIRNEIKNEISSTWKLYWKYKDEEDYWLNQLNLLEKTTG